MLFWDDMTVTQKRVLGVGLVVQSQSFEVSRYLYTIYPRM